MTPTAATAAGTTFPPTEEQLYARGMDLVRAIAHRRGRDWYERDEFSGEGALRVLLAIRTRHFPTMAQYEAYLILRMRAVVSRWHLWGRRRKTDVRRPVHTLGRLESEDVLPATEMVIDPWPETAESEVERREAASLVNRAVDALPDRERWLLREHYLNGQSFRDLAAAARLSSGRLCTRLREVVELLRERLTQEGCGGLGL